jgi:hypothetical protein
MVKFQICYFADFLAIPDIYHILALQLRKSHNAPFCVVVSKQRSFFMICTHLNLCDLLQSLPISTIFFFQKRTIRWVYLFCPPYILPTRTFRKSQPDNFQM